MPGGKPFVLDSIFDQSQIAEAYRLVVAVGNEDVLVSFGRGQLSVGVEHEGLLGTLEGAQWQVDVGPGDCVLDFIYS